MAFIKKYFPFFLIWLLLTSTSPFIFFTWPGHPYKALTFCCLALMLLYFIIWRKKPEVNFSILLICIIQIFYYLMMSLYHEDYSYINLCIQLIALIIIVAFIGETIGFVAYVKSYIYVILAMGIGGVLVFFAHLLIGVEPFFSVDYSESGTSYFLGLTTTNVYLNIDNIRILRYSGFFDEPGQYALFSIFAIVLNKVYFDNRRIEKMLIFVTIFTMSMAFYVVVICYWFLFYLNHSNVKYLLFLIFFVFSGFYLISKYEDDNPIIGQISEMTIKRFQADKDVGFEGNNRKTHSDNDKKIFFRYPLFGAGGVKEDVSGSNIYAIPAKFGLIGTFFYYIFLVYLFLLILGEKRNSRIFYLKILFVIGINFMHRPEMGSVFIITVFVSLIHSVKSVNKKNLNIENMNHAIS